MCRSGGCAPYASALLGGISFLLAITGPVLRQLARLGLHRWDEPDLELLGLLDRGVGAYDLGPVRLRMVTRSVLDSLGAFVRNSKHITRGLDITGAKLLWHLLIKNALEKGDDDGMRRDLGYGVA